SNGHFCLALWCWLKTAVSSPTFSLLSFRHFASSSRTARLALYLPSHLPQTFLRSLKLRQRTGRLRVRLHLESFGTQFGLATLFSSQNTKPSSLSPSKLITHQPVG